MRAKIFLITKKDYLNIIFTILMFIGFFIALLPHATHIAAEHSVEHSHAKEITMGLIMGITSLIALIYNNKALKIWDKDKKV